MKKMNRGLQQANGTTISLHEPTETQAKFDGPDVPGYEVQDELGRGGMGVVFKAWQKDLKRWVALKMILTGAHADAEQVARFRAEAKAVARLQHPNIVQIYDIAEHDGLPYLALEYVDGGNLSQKLAGKPLRPRDAAQIVETLARAMHAAHERGIVHRDLKPGNVLLTVEGIPKITDFGLAKRLHDGSGHTQTGAVLGTPSYMAPEQAQGLTRLVGPPSDIYALGAILYQLLTGRPPFRGSNHLETLKMVQNEDPIAPRQLQPDVPRDLQTVCLKCLRKEQAQRYSSALALADDLRRFQAGDKVQARNQGVLEGTLRWAKRKRELLYVLTGALLVLGIGSLMTWFKDPTSSTEEEKVSSSVAVRPIPASDPDNKVPKPPAELIPANAEKEPNPVPPPKPPEDPVPHDPVKRPNPEPEPPGVIGVFEIAKDNNIPTALAFSLAGSHLAWGGSDGTINLQEVVKDSPIRKLRGHQGQVSWVLFSSDGKMLVSAGEDKKILLWDLASEKETCLSQDAAILHLAISPEDQTLNAFCADGKLRSWRLPWSRNGSRVSSLEVSQELLMSGTISPSGRLLATPSAGRNPIRLWSMASGLEILALEKKPIKTVNRLTFSRDERTLAGATADGTIHLWEVTTGKECGEFTNSNKKVMTIAFSPDGKTVAVGTEGRAVRVRNLFTSTSILHLKNQPLPVSILAFSSQGKRLASGDDSRIFIWDLESQLKKSLPSLKQRNWKGCGRIWPVMMPAKRMRPLACWRRGQDKLSFSWNGGFGKLPRWMRSRLTA